MGYRSQNNYDDENERRYREARPVHAFITEWGWIPTILLISAFLAWISA